MIFTEDALEDSAELSEGRVLSHGVDEVHEERPPTVRRGRPTHVLLPAVARAVFGRSVRPDVLFTEFVRVRARAKTLIANSDFTEALSTVPGIPLVVQVIGSADEGVVQATRELVARGVEHINVNMGCPFGRMNSVLAGGGMFRSPETVEPMLTELRALVPGSFPDSSAGLVPALQLD